MKGEAAAPKVFSHCIGFWWLANVPLAGSGLIESGNRLWETICKRGKER
jgi:hypothetical protein